MSYIGNPIVSTDFPVDYFSGNGSTTAFTLSVAPASVNSIDVQVSGVSQSPQTYSVSGTTLTFSAAPPSGTNNIVVRHLGVAGIPNTPSAASVTPAALSTPNAVYWDVSGNIGVGTTSPNGKLETTGRIVASDGGGASRIALNIESNNSSYNYASINAYNYGTAAARNLVLNESGGSVGIGTIPSSWGTTRTIQLGNGAIWNYSSASNLYLSSNHYFDGSVRRYISTGQTAEYLCNGDGTHIWYNAISGTAGGVVSLAERMRIDANGNLLVGTTSAVAGNANAFITNSGNTTLLTKQNGAGFVQSVWHAAAGTQTLISFYSGAGPAQVGTITTNGTGTTYGTSSDYRLKENIKPMTGALDAVQALKPVTYDWKVGGSSQGFIAHELAEVCPEAVVGKKDAVDAEGKPVYQNIDTSFLVATLTAAIQELKAELDATKAEVAALKGAA